MNAPPIPVRHGFALLLALLGPVACHPMSERVHDPSAGTNGGFEHVRSGLPVNWLVYSPRTVPTGRFELHFDPVDFQEGTQSLKFVVHDASSDGGWRSPGLAQQFPAVAGETYVVGFWLKNQGCTWTARIGGVDATTGRYEKFDPSTVPEGEWTHVELTYTVPAEYEELRFELSITAPGTLRIDGFSLEPSTGPAVEDSDAPRDS